MIAISLDILELFSGIGAFSKGFENNGIPFNIVGFSDKEDYANKSFSLIHNVSEEKALGNILDIDSSKLGEIDVITHGSPCQSFTRSGKMEGGDRDSGTESSLMWKTVDIAKEVMPKYILWENVPDVLAQSNIHNFYEYLNELEEYGYNSYHKLLIASDFNSVQKRNRLFVISIRKDIDNGLFEFPKKVELTRNLSEYLEENVDEIYNVPQNILDHLVLGSDENGYKIKNGTKLGFLYANEGDGIDFAFKTSKTRRGRVQIAKTQTLLTGKSVGTVQNGVFRYFTPREYWRLQEFTDADFDKAKSLGLTDEQLYSLAGNSINVNVTTALVKELFKDYIK